MQMWEVTGSFVGAGERLPPQEASPGASPDAVVFDTRIRDARLPEMSKAAITHCVDPRYASVRQNGSGMRNVLLGLTEQAAQRRL